MIRSCVNVVLIALLVAGAGCASGPATTVVVGTDGQSREVSTLQTSLGPKDTLLKATGVFQRLALREVEPQGYQKSSWSFFNSAPKEWPMVVDAFSGVAYAQSAASEQIELIATWQKQGTTTLKITSQLSAPQHAYVVDQIAKELKSSPPGK